MQTKRKEKNTILRKGEGGDGGMLQTATVGKRLAYALCRNSQTSI